MNQVLRSCQTKLRVFFVVSGVCQIKRTAELLQPGIFHSTIFFIFRLRRQHRFRAAREVYAVRAFRVAQSRCARCILRAIQHHEFSVVLDYGRVKSPCGFPAGALRREDRPIRSSAPGPEWPFLHCNGAGHERRAQQEQRKSSLGLHAPTTVSVSSLPWPFPSAFRRSAPIAESLRLL